ncbi:MAG: DUF2268 domain-containing putative Zn-dependent protease [Steroidobacteraceae bacterium]
MIIPLFLDTDDKRFFPADARSVIAEICAATDTEVHNLLPTLANEVELAAQTGHWVIPETGETATAISRRRIRWVVDPARHGGLIGIARDQLRSTLFHELHHLARGSVRESGARRGSIMDTVVSEGLATAFERDAGGRNSPWGRYPPEVTSWIEELLRLPPGVPHGSWMFKHPDGRQWIGYRAGVYIVDQAQRRSGLSAAQLVHTSTSEVLSLAGIDAAL